MYKTAARLWKGHVNSFDGVIGKVENSRDIFMEGGLWP
jgi:hypothetical protein